MVSGIEMPDAPVAAMRQQLQSQLAKLSGNEKIVVFTCRQAADFESLADNSTTLIPLECAGMLPPAFIEYASRMGAAGVVVAGCREADCEYRLGDRWVQERFGRIRAPKLRASAPRDRIATVWSGRNIERVRTAIAELRSRSRRPAANSVVVISKEVPNV
jgi:coenzyme F420-reducing hydrogenase delta subunit